MKLLKSILILLFLSFNLSAQIEINDTIIDIKEIERQLENLKYADTTYNYQEYDNESFEPIVPSPTFPEIRQKDFDSKKWNELVKDLKYDDYATPKKEAEPIQKNPFNFVMPDISGITKIIVILLLLGILLYVFINWLIRFKMKAKNQLTSINYEINTAEQNLPLADLNKLIAKATQDRDEKLLIRLYYLKTIQLLDLKNYIVWERYKTNRNYLQEFNNQEYRKDFIQLTLSYERIWFGDKLVTSNDFAPLQSNFFDFYKKLGYHDK